MVDFTGKRCRSSLLYLVVFAVSLYGANASFAINGTASTFEYRSPQYYSKQYSYSAGPKVPQNGKPSKSSFPDDGCGYNSVRFKGDGYCYPVLRQGPCENLRYWVTVDPDTNEVRILYIGIFTILELFT